MAFGNATFSNAGGAVSDLLQGQATARSLRLKARGSEVEGENYELAADLARQNEDFAHSSTIAKQMMADRNLSQVTGTQTAQLAASGFANSGSALDILRDTASQGALTSALVSHQGAIEEESYRTQATSYENLAKYAKFAAGVDRDMADTAITNSYVTGGIKAVSSVFTLGF